MVFRVAVSIFFLQIETAFDHLTVLIPENPANEYREGKASIHCESQIFFHMFTTSFSRKRSPLAAATQRDSKRE